MCYHAGATAGHHSGLNESSRQPSGLPATVKTVMAPLAAIADKARQLMETGLSGEQKRLVESILEMAEETAKGILSSLGGAGSRSGTVTLRVLLAEDDDIGRRLVVELLESRGHSVVTAANGRLALEALGAGKFDIVFMDVSMPEMDGLTVTRLIRSHTGSMFDPAVPVIALTAHSVPGDRERCIAAGMNGYLSKPFDLDELEAVMRSALSGRLSPAPPDEPENTGENLPILDYDWLMARYEGHLDLLIAILSVYAREASIRLERIRSAMEGNDHEALAYAAHSLKGISATVGAVRVTAAAKALETSPGAAQDREAIQRIEAELKKAGQAIAARLEDLRSRQEPENDPTVRP